MEISGFRFEYRYAIIVGDPYIAFVIRFHGSNAVLEQTIALRVIEKMLSAVF